MLNVTQTLTHLGIHSKFPIQAVQDTTTRIREATHPLITATKLINDILSLNIKFDDPVVARICCAKVIEQIVQNKGEVENEGELLSTSLQYAEEFVLRSGYEWLYARPEGGSSYYTPAPTIQKTVVEEIPMTVAVKENGKIKKGGKQVLAAELYKMYVLDAATPLKNKEFVALLMEKLGMTQAGANTYAYNMKKKFSC